MRRRSLIAGIVGAVAAGFASIARALPAHSESKWTMVGHKNWPMFTQIMRRYERVDVMEAKEGDEDYDDSELRDALTVIGKYGFTGIVLPSPFSEWPQQMTKARMEDIASVSLKLYARDDHDEDVAVLVGRKIRQVRIKYWEPEPKANPKP